MHCTTDKKSIGSFLVEKNVIETDPKYQRESGVWSTEKIQLFIDSIFNGFDIPKLYLHDLRGLSGRYDYAVVDGKQRLHAIWEFMDNKVALADDFEIREEKPRLTPPKKGSKFQDLSIEWQEIFKSKNFDVVFIQNAQEEDIEDLFSRLNNGEPLNSAEKRNAKGGDMAALIREIAEEDFFTEKLAFNNRRFSHYEVAAKYLLIERSVLSGSTPFCDLKKKFLDLMVEENRSFTGRAKEKLKSSVCSQLASLNRIFSNKDDLLSKQSYAPMYYMFVKVIEKEYAHKDLYVYLTKFVKDFHVLRQENLLKSEEKRDPSLSEFGRLIQQGTNDAGSLENRVGILRRFFLQAFPKVELKDPQRDFSSEERLALYFLSDKKCQICSKEIKDLEDMHADHRKQWSHGGETSLSNGRALCESCNTSLAQRLA
jgi:hypothetical protein